MTIFFPDVSSFEAGLRIQPGTAAVAAKATEGTYYRDASYADFEQQARTVGAVFSAYHFLTEGNGAGQADYCHAAVGGTPVMLDVETQPQTGSKATVADCAAFIARMRRLGGRVWGAYFPRWYWQEVGGDLASLGVALVSSNYPAAGYSDSGPGWAPYGGASPVVWQYTSSQSYGGRSVDFNAFRGSVEELAALIQGGIMALTQQDIFDIWGYSNATLDKGVDMRQHLVDAATAAAQARDEVAAVKAELDAVNAKLDQVLAALKSGGAGVDSAVVASDVVHDLAADLAKGGV